MFSTANTVIETENKENNSIFSNMIECEKPNTKDINDVPVGQKSKFFLEEYPESNIFISFS